MHFSRSLGAEFLHDADPPDLAQRQRHGLAALLQENQLVLYQENVASTAVPILDGNSLIGAQVKRTVLVFCSLNREKVTFLRKQIINKNHERFWYHYITIHKRI